MSRALHLVQPLATALPSGALLGAPQDWLPGAIVDGEGIVHSPGTPNLRIEVGPAAVTSGSVWRHVEIESEHTPTTATTERFVGEIGIVAGSAGVLVLHGEITDGDGSKGTTFQDGSARRLLASIAKRLLSGSAAPTT